MNTQNLEQVLAEIRQSAFDKIAALGSTLTHEQFEKLCVRVEKGVRYFSIGKLTLVDWPNMLRLDDVIDVGDPEKAPHRLIRARFGMAALEVSPVLLVVYGFVPEDPHSAAERQALNALWNEAASALRSVAVYA